MGIYQGDNLLTAKPHSVLYTEQTLTEEQKAQARENVGAASTAYVDEKVAGAGDVFIAESYVTTSAEIEAAYQSGKLVVCVDAGMPFHLVFRRSATEHWFDNVDSEYYCTYCVINDEWEFHENMYAPRNHADIHKATGRDPITPDMIGALAAPTPTTADNGKFLRVVNGAPAWATVQNAEEVEW